jgi:hypothetical protein
VSVPSTNFRQRTSQVLDMQCVLDHPWPIALGKRAFLDRLL